MSDSVSHLIGAVLALGSAALFAVSAILFRRLGDSISALGLNVGKGIVALVCLGALLLTQPWNELDTGTTAALVISGVLGIALGDTLYFLALTRLGAHVTLIFNALIPILTALAAWVVLGERLSAAAWAAVILTIAGVSLVLMDHTNDDQGLRQWRSGVMFGLLFVVISVAATVFTKIGVENVPSIQATFVRQLWAFVALAAWATAVRAWPAWGPPLRDSRIASTLLIASLVGAFLGTWLAVAALKYTHAAIATTLSNTSPLFVLPLAVWWLKERVSARAVIGAAVAVAGVGLYFASVM